ncbi:SDR family oxidoreductase [Kribbella sp. NPDC051770]|uniref:SDR family oxidoreductase n=1 Tax=Kribbella sp. NPDC051770 TaxID=3155413 RepID=UPI003422693E
MAEVLVVGGSGGLGLAIARKYAGQGDSVVVTSRTKTGADEAAALVGGATRGIAVDLAQPETIESALAEITAVDHLVVTAIAQSGNTLAAFDLTDAVTAATVKLVGYAEVVRVLTDRFRPGASVVLLGGLAKYRPYPGSTMVTATNGGVSALARTLAVEAAPVRVNVLHPGVVGDSPKWSGTDTAHVAARTPIGRTVTVEEVVDAVDFLLRNGAVNAVDLELDGGMRVL